jgi:hypothetical protein
MSDTFENVANGVEDALRRQFGAAAEIERVMQNEHMAIFGFSVDGISHSLSVNVTP